MLRSVILRLPATAVARNRFVTQRYLGLSCDPITSFSRGFASGDKSPASGAAHESVGEDVLEESNLLEGKRTRDSLHESFTNRSMDVVRYDYFAQRAELEAELEAASTFRSLSEMAKQQAMGYLELMEEYGDAEFGATVDNLDVCAAAEHENAENKYRDASSVAADEDLEQIEDWFDDMSSASSRAASRLELVSSMIDSEMMEEAEENENDEVSEKAKH